MIAVARMMANKTPRPGNLYFAKMNPASDEVNRIAVIEESAMISELRM